VIKKSQQQYKLQYYSKNKGGWFDSCNTTQYSKKAVTKEIQFMNTLGMLNYRIAPVKEKATKK